MEYIINVFNWIFKNIFFLNILLAILLVFFERKDPTTTWLWLMIFFFLPGIGFLLYLFIGQDLRKEKLFKVKEEDDEIIQDRVNYQEKIIQSQKLNFNDSKIKEYQDIIKLHLISDRAIYTQDNKVELYFNGVDKFYSLINSLEKAQKYIHLEYYIIKNDNLGKKIMKILIKKANQGVEVRLLYDAMGGRNIPRKFFKEFFEAGGKAACFFPPFVPRLTPRINYRNHRKICIIDGKEAFIGGFNIGDEYLGYSKRFGFWRDTHCKIEGSAVYELQWRFLLDWRFAFNEILGINQKYFPKLKVKGRTGIQIVSSGPDSKWTNIRNGYFKMIANATKKVYIQTPYFIPDDSILEALKISALSGVDVRIIIPGKPDHPFVYWASLSYMGELLQSKVKFYIYEGGFIHSKVILMDDIVSSIGSANLDIRSFKLNFEVNAFIYDKNINRKIEKEFLIDLYNCKKVTIKDYEKRSIPVKFKESVSRLLSPML